MIASVGERWFSNGQRRSSIKILYQMGNHRTTWGNPDVKSVLAESRGQDPLATVGSIKNENIIGMCRCADNQSTKTQMLRAGLSTGISYLLTLVWCYSIIVAISFVYSTTSRILQVFECCVGNHKWTKSKTRNIFLQVHLSTPQRSFHNYISNRQKR